MRRIAKIDKNQLAIVRILREVGATVQTLATVGGGCPDLLVGFKGANYLMEIKDGEKIPSARKLTPDQVDWHGSWRGAVHVVTEPVQALKIIGAI